MPVLRAFLNSLRDLCVALDDAAKSTAAEPDEHLGKFVKTVATLYASVKNDDDRNFACICLYIVGWQIAYQLNTTTVVAKWRLPDLTYKLADQVTRNYWEGLVAFSSNNWPAAAANLAYAFHTTPARFHRHRRIILTLLIPAKLACCLAKQSEGAFPSARLLHKYNLPELAQLVAAFQVGAGPHFPNPWALALSTSAAAVWDGDVRGGRLGWSERERERVILVTCWIQCSGALGW